MHALSDPSWLCLATLSAAAMAWALGRMTGWRRMRAAVFAGSLVSSLALSWLSASPLLALVAGQVLVAGVATLLGDYFERDLPRSRWSAQGYAALGQRDRCRAA